MDKFYLCLFLSFVSAWIFIGVKAYLHSRAISVLISTGYCSVSTCGRLKHECLPALCEFLELLCIHIIPLSLSCLLEFCSRYAQPSTKTQESLNKFPESSVNIVPSSAELWLTLLTGTDSPETCTPSSHLACKNARAIWISLFALMVWIVSRKEMDTCLWISLFALMVWIVSRKEMDTCLSRMIYIPSFKDCKPALYVVQCLEIVSCVLCSF